MKGSVTAILLLTLHAFSFAQGVHLIVGSGSYYSGGDNAFTVIAGHIENDGEIFTPNSSLRIVGKSIAQKITCYTLSGSYCPNIYSSSTYNTVLGDVDQENDEGLQIETNTLVNGTHFFKKGSTEIREGNYWLNNSSTPFSGNTATKFFVTTGAYHGLLKRSNIGSTPVLFPIGSAANLIDYTPASISNGGTPDDFGVRVYDNVYFAYYTSNGDPVKTGVTNVGFVKKTWIVNKSTPVTSGFATAGFTAMLQWNAINENTYFTPSRDDDISVARNHDTLWIPQDPQGPSTNPYGLGPYTRTDLVTYDNAFYPYYPITVSAINHVLPLVGLHLGASVSENDVVSLKWATLSETNTANFLVQRSVDGIIYTTIGIVPASGNSSAIRHYDFTDSTPNLSFNYYRIKALDKDGKFMFSNVEVIKINRLSKGIILLSNPAINLARILFKNEPGDYILDLYSDLASKAKSETISISTGNQVYSLPVKGLAQGLYYIRLTNHQTKEITTLKVIIVN